MTSDFTMMITLNYEVKKANSNYLCKLLEIAFKFR